MLINAFAGRPWERFIPLASAIAAIALTGEAQSGPSSTVFYPDEFRSITAVGNNVANPLWGSAGQPMERLMPAAYEDGVEQPAVWGRPSPRLISNIVVAQEGEIPSSAGLTNFTWQWGQFIDHDIALAVLMMPLEPFDIPVPTGDPFFDPLGTGTAVIHLERSIHTMVNGVRQQRDMLTNFIDGSMVYGSDPARAQELRTLDGTGRLKTSAGNLLPFNVNAFPNEPTAHDPSLFIAGDVRANEQVCLTAMHTLFMREHNHWADVIARGELRGRMRGTMRDQRKTGDHLTGDEIYEMARAIVAAEIQAITYQEFLPNLLGPDAIVPYQGYDPDLHPGIMNEFAAAAYRVGHTLLSPRLARIDSEGNTIPAGDLSLLGAFFNPQEVIDHGIDPLLRGLAVVPAQQVDNHVIDDVRNFLFGPPGAGGFDLAALNIQRGREHGLPSFNAVRAAVGLTPFSSFEEITSDPDTQARLAAAYASVDDIDLWIGCISEDHFPGAQVGTTLHTILSLQFTALRDGDRFWYQRYLPPELACMVEETTLADIIRRNADIGDELQDDVFHLPEAQSGD